MRRLLGLCLIWALLSACVYESPPTAATIPVRVMTPTPTVDIDLARRGPGVTPTVFARQAPTPIPTRTPLPQNLNDASGVMSGVCFEAALAASGETFVLRSADDHIRLYDRLDALCTRPITRHPFDFSHGALLVGLWTAGRGCTADHEVLSVQRDDAAQTIRLDVRFVTRGECPYDLVRPFWVWFEAATSYQVAIVVER